MWSIPPINWPFSVHLSKLSRPKWSLENADAVVGVFALVSAFLLRRDDGRLDRAELRAYLQRLETATFSSLALDATNHTWQQIESVCNSAATIDRVRELLRPVPESTFYTDWVSRQLNRLLHKACASLPKCDWRAVASRTSKRRQVIYRLKWHSRLQSSPPNNTLTTNVAQSHKSYGPQALIVPVATSDICVASPSDQIYWPRVDDVIHTFSSITASITGSFFDPSNHPLRVDRNLRIIAALSALQRSDLFTLSRLGLDDVVDDLLRDLEKMIEARTGAMRFVCTNTTIEQLEPASWASDRALRRLMLRSADLLAKKPRRLTVHRVFIVQNPKALLDARRFTPFYDTLEENRLAGIDPILFLAAKMPNGCPYSYSDFYCIPDRSVFISVPPAYLLTKVTCIGRQRDIVAYYSEISELLLADADDSNVGHACRWSGGARERLQALLAELSSQRDWASQSRPGQGT